LIDIEKEVTRDVSSLKAPPVASKPIQTRDEADEDTETSEDELPIVPPNAKDDTNVSWMILMISYKIICHRIKF